MLVIHWAKQNQTHRILKDGIRPTCRRRRPLFQPGPKQQINAKGVYVFPYSGNSVVNSTWRRQLKKWSNRHANMNGFVFRLEEGDFPLYASDWESNRAAFTSPGNRELQEYTMFDSLGQLAARYGKEYFTDEGDRCAYDDFEMIIPRHVAANRIIKVIRERSRAKRRPPEAKGEP